jgi:membrane dipeptidase
MLRRKFIAASSFLFAGNALSQQKIFIADSHNHYGIALRRGTDIRNKLGERMKESGVSLLSWSFFPDGPFLGFSLSNGIYQKSKPESGKLLLSFDKQLEFIEEALKNNGVKIVKTVEDLELAVNGEPHVVLNCEGADFLEGELGGLKYAYEKSIRHLQLVHYIDSPIGDRQTDKPIFNGLSEFGKKLIPVANDEGILLDLAHSTSSTIDQVLDLSSLPIVWSHGYLSEEEGTHSSGGYKARALSINHAKKITGKGGAIGLWGLGATAGNSIKGYATELKKMVDLLGVGGVMIGSDVDGLPLGAIVKEIKDLRYVIDELYKLGMDDASINAIAIGNYARVLKSAMLGKKA